MKDNGNVDVTVTSTKRINNPVISLVHILNIVIRISFLSESIGGVAGQERGRYMGQSEFFKVIVVPYNVKVQQ